MEEAVSHSILRGRPYGGVATLVRNDFLPQIKIIKCSERFNIMSINMSLIINVYFPCTSPGSDVVLQAILLDISDIISLYPDYDIILGGDINNELIDNTKSSIIIRNFISEFKLNLCQDIIKPNCSYTYFNEALQHFSFVDYFIISNSLRDKLLQFKVVVDKVNLSDHLPVISSFNIALDTIYEPKHTPSADNIERLRWDHAELSLFHSRSYELLLPLLNCLDPLYSSIFNNLSHHSVVNTDYDQPYALNNGRARGINLIESIYASIVFSLNNCAANTIPKMRVNKLKFWWDQEVNEMKRRATISHRAWIDANRPSTGIIYENRKKDKYAYCNKIRQGKMKEKQDISNSLHDALINKNKNSFWKMWRNKFKLKNNRSMTVNGKSCDVDIANEFATHLF